MQGYSQGKIIRVFFDSIRTKIMLYVKLGGGTGAGEEGELEGGNGLMLASIRRNSPMRQIDRFDRFNLLVLPRYCHMR